MAFAGLFAFVGTDSNACCCFWRVIGVAGLVCQVLDPRGDEVFSFRQAGTLTLFFPSWWSEDHLIRVQSFAVYWPDV